jgi:hypothetical protein
VGATSTCLGCVDSFGGGNANPSGKIFFRGQPYWQTYSVTLHLPLDNAVSDGPLNFNVEAWGGRSEGIVPSGIVLCYLDHGLDLIRGEELDK